MPLAIDTIAQDIAALTTRFNALSKTHNDLQSSQPATFYDALKSTINQNTLLNARTIIALEEDQEYIKKYATLLLAQNCQEDLMLLNRNAYLAEYHIHTQYPPKNHDGNFAQIWQQSAQRLEALKAEHPHLQNLFALKPALKKQLESQAQKPRLLRGARLNALSDLANTSLLYTHIAHKHLDIAQTLIHCALINHNAKATPAQRQQTHTAILDTLKTTLNNAKKNRNYAQNADPTPMLDTTPLSAQDFGMDIKKVHAPDVPFRIN